MASINCVCRPHKFAPLMIMCLVTFFATSTFLYTQHFTKPYKKSSQDFLNTNTEGIALQSKKIRGLLIVTLFRSGSTFTGNYFNQQADIFYVYEPLVPFGEACQEATEINKLEQLRDIFHCHIRNQKDIYSDIKNFSLKTNKASNLCYRDNFCFRYRSRALCSGENCKNGNNETCEGCGPVDVTSASRKCRSSKLVVVKVIRLCNLDRLKPLLTDPELDLKILNLVRDPRGIMSSRSEVAASEGLKDLEIKKSCDLMEKGINYATDRDDEWIKGRYKILRYEDLCENPLLLGLRLYEYTGLTMTSQMISWILNNTQGSLSDVGDPVTIKALMRHPQHTALVLSDPYTTTRNSSATWRKWKTRLNVNQVMSVQSACKNVMIYLGYRLIEDQNQLIDSSFKILNKFCPEKVYTFC